MNDELRVMSIQAHQDDFELTCGGVFAALRKRYGNKVRLKILTTSRGASGHYEMSLEETYRRREKEAKKSAELIGAEYDNLTCLDGSNVHAQVFIDRNTLGGLWNAVRAFEPHYIFCPPVTSDSLAGVHIDHYNTGLALRFIAYQIGVPHAYPVTNGVFRKKVIDPVIINVDDGYSMGTECHVAVDITDFLETKFDMALCHESQLQEWLPWRSNEELPTLAEAREQLKKRHEKSNKRYKSDDNVAREFYCFTRWGKIPSLEDVGILFDRYDLTVPGKEYLKK